MELTHCSKTCIDGHRAPLCDPKKHRNKIMFRRPAPGRPPRQCGHPKSLGCDCLSKRTLCCVLSNDQWDRVERGEIVSVHMYNNSAELEEGQHQMHELRRDSTPYQETPSHPSISGPTNPIQQSMPFRQPPVPRFQMFGVGGPQGDSAVPQADPFAWTGIAPQAEHILQGFPLSGEGQSSSQFQNPGDSFGVPVGSSGGVLPYGMPRGSVSHQSTPSAGWQVPRPEYLNFNATQHSSGQVTPLGNINLNQFSLPDMVHAAFPSQPLAPSENLAHNVPTNAYNDFIMPQQSSMSMDDFAMDMDLSSQDRQAMAPAAEPTQSCCSSKRRAPAPMQTYHNFQYPGAPPSQQFPCPRCASTMCTCNNCPEVMQSAEQNGAWARACGRGGHLDAGSFAINTAPPPVQFQPQVQQIPSPAPSQPTNGGSCCSSKTTASASPPPAGDSTVGSGQWHAYQNIMHNENNFVDPAMIYPPIHWPSHSS